MVNTVVHILQLHTIYIRNVVVSNSRAHNHLSEPDGSSWWGWNLCPGLPLSRGAHGQGPATLPCLCACWLQWRLDQGFSEGGMRNSGHEPAPQSLSQSLQSAGSPTGHSWALPQSPGCSLHWYQGCALVSEPSAFQERPPAGKSLPAIETFLYRRGCELCKYLLYKSAMWLWRKNKKAT